LAGNKGWANFDPRQRDSKKLPLPPAKLWIFRSFPCQQSLPACDPSIRLTYAGFFGDRSGQARVSAWPCPRSPSGPVCEGGLVLSERRAVNGVNVSRVPTFIIGREFFAPCTGPSCHHPVWLGAGLVLPSSRIYRQAEAKFSHCRGIGYRS